MRQLSTKYSGGGEGNYQLSTAILPDNFIKTAPHYIVKYDTESAQNIKFDILRKSIFDGSECNHLNIKMCVR
jgi:hypothetical protein